MDRNFRIRQCRVCVVSLFSSFLPFVPLTAHADTASVRVHQRFDSDWRFRQDDPPKAPQGASITDWRWKPAPGLKNAKDATLPNASDADWQVAKIGEEVFQNKPGFAWYQTDLGAGTFSQISGTKMLHFEAVDDRATVFLNGQKLLSHDGWNEPFDVVLDKAWHEGGPNIVMVLVENTGGGGDISKPVILTRRAAEKPSPFSTPAYNDRAWRRVHLPHDYVIEGKFDQTADVSHGALPVSSAWYRKTFTLPASYQGKSVWIDFDGVYRDSVVYFNGHKLGRHPSGYTGFRYDIGKYANFGGKNVLSVSVDARRQEGWWYEGGGIYRHVWLNVANPVHAAPWGTFVTSQVSGIDPTGKTAPSASAKISSTLTLKTRLVNEATAPKRVTLVSEIVAPNGRIAVTVKTPQTLAASSDLEVPQTAQVPNAQLWSIETPTLYKLRTRVQNADGTLLDVTETPFGIRTIAFDVDRGFFLNGKLVKIKGTCNHQDFAGVGIGMSDSLNTWRIKKLKAMGSNAYRASHNPPTPELLDECDRQGMLVMDENRHLGDTTGSKSAPGTPYSDLSEVADLVLRDRNHPSVIMWSMCNEEWALGGSPEGAQIFNAMRDKVHQYDTTRPVTSALNSGFGGGISTVEDLQGINYNIDIYDSFHKDHPNLPIFGSETASIVSTRGIYAEDKERGYVSVYFDKPGPGGSASAEELWAAVATRPFLEGGFVWTGFDYKGEPTPYWWPCVNSHFGIMDMCGFPKDLYYYYKAWWGDKPVVHILPHWNWAGKAGQPIDVWCFSNADEVELTLNGKSLGRKPMPQFGRIEWSVPYAPGTLIANGYKSGKLVGTDRVETAGAPASLRLTTDRTKLTPDGEDVTMVEVAVLDAQGRVVPTADNQVTFAVSGAAHVAGVGNGDPSSHEPDQALQRHAFNGLCMVIVGSGEKSGSARLVATSPGLKDASLPIMVK